MPSSRTALTRCAAHNKAVSLNAQGAHKVAEVLLHIWRHLESHIHELLIFCQALGRGADAMNTSHPALASGSLGEWLN
jgi:hypothetical protein